MRARRAVDHTGLHIALVRTPHQLGTVLECNEIYRFRGFRLLVVNP